MTFDEFQDVALPVKTVDRDEPTFWACGLGGEAGEALELLAPVLGLTLRTAAVLNTAKKLERDGASAGLDERLVAECGNVLFYLAQVLRVRGLRLSDAALRELEALAAMAAPEAAG